MADLSVTGSGYSSVNFDFEKQYGGNHITEVYTYSGTGTVTIGSETYLFADLINLEKTWYVDSYEDDDTAETAQLFPLGTSQKRTLHKETADSDLDFDWVKFEVTSGNAYTMRTSEYTDEFNLETDTEIFLYNEAMTLITSADEDEDDEYYTLLEWTADFTGTAYLLIRDYNNGSPEGGDGYPGDYVLTITETAAP